MVTTIISYLAELPCDGSGRDLFEHDTTENPTPRDDYIDHIHAIGTQDTDVNVNSDVQLIPKNETDLSKSMSYSIQCTKSNQTANKSFLCS